MYGYGFLSSNDTMQTKTLLVILALGVSWPEPGKEEKKLRTISHYTEFAFWVKPELLYFVKHWN